MLHSDSRAKKKIKKKDVFQRHWGRTLNFTAIANGHSVPLANISHRYWHFCELFNLRKLSNTVKVCRIWELKKGNLTESNSRAVHECSIINPWSPAPQKPELTQETIIPGVNTACFAKGNALIQTRWKSTVKAKLNSEKQGAAWVSPSAFQWLI